MTRKFKHLQQGDDDRYCGAPRGDRTDKIEEVDCDHCLRIYAVHIFLGAQRAGFSS